MDKKAEILAAIEAQGILPLYFHENAEVAAGVLNALFDAGIRVVEFTNRGENALENFKKLRQICDARTDTVFLAAGTIKNALQAETFLDAGADLLITPGFAEGILTTAEKRGKLCIPGCMSVSEIIAAENAGIKAVKLFPGNVLGVDFLRAVKPLFPNLLFMPTGGVELAYDNLKMWFDAGVFAVGIGSNLIDRRQMDEREFSAIEVHAKQAMEWVTKVRSLR